MEVTYISAHCFRVLLRLSNRNYKVTGTSNLNSAGLNMSFKYK